MTNILSLLDNLRKNGHKLTTAESCTGGLIAAAITDIAGSSDIFDRGFVTYSNQSKIDMLGVSPATLGAHGAVSEQTCREMLQGAIKNSGANIAIATTGIAGPSGGSPEKPVGLVYIGILQYSNMRIVKLHLSGSRAQVRAEAVERAFELLSSLAV
jgi:nicotinamide-nucleotide amidase